MINVQDLNVWMPGTFRDRLMAKFSPAYKEKTQTKILHNINAILPPGCLIAILGTSGSGMKFLFNITFWIKQNN